LEDPDLDRRIILRWIFRKWDMADGLDGYDSGQGQVTGTCKCGNEPSGCVKYVEFLDLLRTD
jgi:hypothetical protein